jgi:transposase
VSEKGVTVPKGRKFPPEFRAEAVRLHRIGERSLRETAQELAIAPETLRRWVQQAEIDEGKAQGLSTEERAELTRLRRENRILREEKEILVRRWLAGYKRVSFHFAPAEASWMKLVGSFFPS